MAEQIDLTTPIAIPSITSYQITKLILDWEGAGIVISLKSNTGQHLECGYNGEEATALMLAMNKMNFTVTSIQKKVLQRLVTDGKLTGTISGTPD